MAPGAAQDGDLERRRAASEPELADLRAMLDATAESVWLFSAEGVALAANRTALERWRRPAEAVLGRTMHELIPGALGASRLARIQEAARTGRPVEFEDERDGIRFAHTCYPVASADGRVERVTVFSRDVTGQRRAEEAMRRFELLASVSRDIVLFMRREDGRILEANAAAVAAYGYAREELLSMRVADLRAPDTAHLTEAQMAEADARGLLFETAHRRKDGSTFEVEVSSRGATVEGTRTLVSVVRDIGRRREVERALRESEERFRSLFTHMTEGFALGEALCDASGAARDFRFLEMNEAFERQSGLDRARARGLPMREVLPGLEQSWIDTYCGVALGGPPRRFESYNRDLDRHFDVHCFSPGPGRFAIVFNDVTDRRRMEQELRTSEERLRALADSIPQLAWTARPDGWVGWYNRRWYEYTGTTPEQVEGWGWRAVHDPAVLPEVERRWSEAIASGAALEMEFPLRGADGRYRRFLTRVVPLRDEAGRVRQWFGTSTDVTDLVEAREALAEADRRKTEFLAVLSHELRNPLAPIQNALVLLDRAAPGSEAAARARDVLHRQTAQLTRLVGDLLDLSRITHGKIEVQLARLDAREVLRRAHGDARELFEARGVALELSEDAAPLWVDADAARLSQMVGNVLHNALKFTPAGGRVELSAARRGRACEVRVRDTGAGIDPAELERIFEPFVQAEGAGRGHGGLGLGLALVRELAAKHGGTVTALSAGAGHGSEFVIALPLARAPQAGAVRAPPGAAGAPLAILIVEDNEDAGATLADVLALDGHRVVRAVTGREGLRALAGAPADVLLCDVGLPDISGHEVVRAARALPGGRALYAVALTGYAQPEDRAAALAAGFDEHLAKPPELEVLRRLLAGVARRLAAGAGAAG